MALFRRDIGRRGEQAAAVFLRRRGLRIVEKNYHCGFGEIDLICADGKTIVFVEVKTLSANVHADPEEHVTPSKRMRIERAARMWLQSLGNPRLLCRFDVVSVVMPKVGEPTIRHIIDAFPPSRWCR
ncbi:MAG: YraN family protein [Phycisphaerae bacterium]|nr:YraN family protein [Phycisphaerae bacterium]